MSERSMPHVAANAPRGENWVVEGGVVDVSRPAATPIVATIRSLPQNLRFDVRKSAIIVVDMQNDFLHPNGWMAGAFGIDPSAAVGLAAPINKITNAFRKAGMPVVWLNWGVRGDRTNLPPVTRYPFSEMGKTAGLGDEVPAKNGIAAHPLLAKDSWGARIIDQLDVRPEDIHVAKQRISGFWDTPLDSILRNLGIRTVFFTGINSDHCVLGTLMDACFLGYDTVMVDDLTATSSPDFCHQAAIHNVRFCFGFTVTSTDLTAGLDAAKPVA
jgi:ureidoacrylate peracid hydrolase